jgi:hypothetical protein
MNFYGLKSNLASLIFPFQELGNCSILAEKKNAPHNSEMAFLGPYINSSLLYLLRL